jgi:hypothetical protein
MNWYMEDQEPKGGRPARARRQAGITRRDRMLPARTAESPSARTA